MRSARWQWRGWLLTVGHALAWLPFARVKRVAFLYHYIPSLLFSFMAAGLVLDVLTARAVAAFPRRGWMLRAALVCALLTLVARSFVYFAPIYLGMPMEYREVKTRARQLERPWGNSGIISAYLDSLEE